VIPPLEGWPADDNSKPVLIGLTGPIGCGKSTVAGFLRDVGGLVIDADDLAREATVAHSSALPEIRERFGDAVFAADGTLDRSALARIVFNDAKSLADLELIVHPRVRVLVDARLEAAVRERVPFVVLEAIKLVEGGLADRCDEVWIVTCQPTAQRARMAGRGAAQDDIERRLATQGDDLADRLQRELATEQVHVRLLPTDAAIEATRELVEDALAEALDRPI
jgi:dephospho-CoA kinase